MKRRILILVTAIVMLMGVVAMPASASTSVDGNVDSASALLGRVNWGM